MAYGLGLRPGRPCIFAMFSSNRRTGPLARWLLNIAKSPCWLAVPRLASSRVEPRAPYTWDSMLFMPGSWDPQFLITISSTSVPGERVDVRNDEPFPLRRLMESWDLVRCQTSRIYIATTFGRTGINWHSVYLTQKATSDGQCNLGCFHDWRSIEKLCLTSEYFT